MNQLHDTWSVILICEVGNNSVALLKEPDGYGVRQYFNGHWRRAEMHRFKDRSFAIAVYERIVKDYESRLGPRRLPDFEKAKWTNYPLPEPKDGFKAHTEDLHEKRWSAFISA